MNDTSLPDGIDLVIRPRARDIGSFSVRRSLPAPRRRLVGPFIFFDHMGPVDFEPGQGIDVRPHPHIGLATVTYLFEGEILHRDSLGVVQPIRPGAVNWMIAGRGIVHSERTDPGIRATARRMHGIQTWVALPTEHEQHEPDFAHHPADTLPEISHPGVTMRLIVGTAFGEQSPVKTLSPIFYIAAEAEAGAAIDLPEEHVEKAIYVVSGEIEVAGERFEEGAMVVLADGSNPTVRATAATRAMLLGGAPIDGDRQIWWNFVASSDALMEQAKADWKEGRFPVIPDDADEFIPLPGK
jgi:redox-sensitive bicupin YhaK (pirin superfamily)